MQWYMRRPSGVCQFMSGEVEIAGVKHRITVFRNGYRTDVNRQPNYHIYRDTGAPAAAGTAAAPAHAAPPPAAPAPEELPSIDLNADRDDFRGPDRW